MTPGPSRLRFLFLTPFAFAKNNNNVYYIRTIYIFLLYNEDNRHLQILRIVLMRFCSSSTTSASVQYIHPSGRVGSGIGIETGPET
jgi:hypothetical protein